MRAGRFRFLFSIWTPAAATPAGGGNFTDLDYGTKPVGTTYGDLQTFSSAEQFHYGTLGLTGSHRISTRWTDLIKATSKLTMGGRTFIVQGPPIDPDGRRRELQVNVVERTSP